MSADETISNRTFDEIAVGETASATRTLTRDDVALFAALSGDLNPTHSGSLDLGTVHSMLGGALTSGVLGTKLPGPGTIYVGQSLRFHRQIQLGDTLTTSVTVTEKRPATGTVVLDCECRDDKGVRVMSGLAGIARSEASPPREIRSADRTVPRFAADGHRGGPSVRRVLAHCGARRGEGRNHRASARRSRSQDPGGRRGAGDRSRRL